MDEWRSTERGQGLHHRLEVRDRRRWREPRPIEQRLVVVEARRVDAPGHGERKGSGGRLPGTREVKSLWHPSEHAGHARVRAEVGQESVTYPSSNEQAIDQHEPDRLAGRDRRASEPVPLGAAARESPDVPLDARVLGLEVVVDPLHRRLALDSPAARTVIGPVGSATLPHACRHGGGRSASARCRARREQGAPPPPPARNAPRFRTSRRARVRVQLLAWALGLSGARNGRQERRAYDGTTVASVQPPVEASMGHATWASRD